jgi:hypothetical protein
VVNSAASALVWEAQIVDAGWLPSETTSAFAGSLQFISFDGISAHIGAS